MVAVLATFDRESVTDLVPALRDLYAEVYAEPPYFEGPEHVEQFLTRFAGHRREPAFRLAGMFDDGQLIGYLYGFGIDVDSPEWDTLLIRTSGAGSDLPLRRPTALVCELLVRAGHRRLGVARRLHDAFVADRREPQAALLAHPEATAAQTAYSTWGWRKVGYGRPFPGAPEYETLMLLRGPARVGPGDGPG